MSSRKKKHEKMLARREAREQAERARNAALLRESQERRARKQARADAEKRSQSATQAIHSMIRGKS